MIAAYKNLVLDNGATFSLNVRYLNADKTPIDLTGYTGLFTVSKLGARVPTVHTEPATCSDDGWVDVEITDEETFLIPAGKYSYMLEITEPAGAVIRLLIGELTVRF